MNAPHGTSPLSAQPRRRALRGSALAVGLALSGLAGLAGLSGCLAAPTPHPEHGPDAWAPGGGVDALQDAAPTGARYADACAAIGGRWDDASGLCDLDFSAGIDTDYAEDMDASAATAGDGGTPLSGDADTAGGQGADGGSEPPAPTTAPAATVTAVEVAEARGREGSYTFTVTVTSPDTGCDQYADWWELVRLDGSLVYRRVLSHSHVDEQPFTRDGGPVGLASDEVVVVRAHMHGPEVGYGAPALVGTVQGGFAPTSLPAGFAWKLAGEAPTPPACAF